MNIVDILSFTYNQIFLPYEMYFRILISAVLGFFIGLDRSSKNKPAGLRTYTYVTVASTLITLVSIYSAEILSSPNSGTMMDPMRLASQIITGLGFLGAGVILKDGLNVKGLTSAAMIFFAGGVGVGIGAGFYGIVIFATIITFILTKLSGLLEKRSLMKLRKLSTSKRSKISS
ncbi:MgtC/SapB family protein [Chengkuizengella axinellae]|uniref:MgtC/SapB family protein n=1 Tax=Chengkuizengella axinellae TaxID=3064388 RepID=A0ABT9IZH9_9BACL|nr:MgtC/SapB family protein [Chengkuizengella sp. 2205SS18-9]MDP5274780.1 MgtC/SapB family protein [Chengkuizengella sp. 2205SS18-9]